MPMLCVLPVDLCIQDQQEPDGVGRTLLSAASEVAFGLKNIAVLGNIAGSANHKVQVKGGGKECAPHAYSPGLFCSISCLIFSTNSTANISSVFSLPRVRTFTFPASASLSPTTSRNGTFCIACSRIFAFIFSLRESTCTRTPIALS